MRAAASILSLSVMVPLASLSAQTQPPIERGARVRIIATDCRLYRQSAEFEALRGDELIVVTDSTVRCPLSSVGRLEVRSGQRGRTGFGAIIGGLAGVVTGSVIGGHAAARCEEDRDPLSQSNWCGMLTLTGGLAGLAGGAAIGAVVGSLMKTDRWVEVPLDQVTASLVWKRGNRLGIGMSLEF
jgi:hypothetical protein